MKFWNWKGQGVTTQKLLNSIIFFVCKNSRNASCDMLLIYIVPLYSWIVKALNIPVVSKFSSPSIFIRSKLYRECTSSSFHH